MAQTASGRERLDAASLGVRACWDYDLVSNSFITTEGLRAIYGIAPGETFGLGLFISATHADDRELWRELFGGAYSLPAPRVHFRILRPGGDLRWLACDISVAPGMTGPSGFTGTVTDITEARRAANALTESEERLRIALEAGRMAVWEVDLQTGRLTNSPELNLLFGLPMDAEPTLADVRQLYAPGELDRIQQMGIAYEQVRARSGVSRSVRRDWVGIPSADRTQIQVEFAIITPDGTPKQLLLRAQHAPSIDGHGQRVTGVLLDITDRKLAEDRMALVARELQHRVKNSLATVQALALQSFRPGVDNATAAANFSGRVQALAAATDAILQSGSTDAPIWQVVGRILEPYRAGGTDPFEVSGPAVHLPGRLATALGMALHELCTNALKYGALSVPQGRVKLGWAQDGDSVVLNWAEHDGPHVTVPERTGFGTRLLKTLVPKGDVAVDYAPHGVTCRIVLPLAYDRP